MSSLVPDFFIVGVQKAGTTTLAGMLGRHPQIRMSTPKEPMFFCCDDATVHRNEFLSSENPPWLAFDWESDHEALLAEYHRRCFGGEGEDDGGSAASSPGGNTGRILKADASTSYALSRKATLRIAELRPDARIIFILRDPVKRAESAYWHTVRKGLSASSFDESVRFGGQNILEFGCYESQIRGYQELLGKERIHVAHYEEMVRDSAMVCNGITNFLDLPSLGDTGTSDLHLNPSFYPRSMKLQALVSWLAKKRGMLPTSTYIRGTSGPAGEGSNERGHGPGGGNAKTEGVLKRSYRRFLTSSRKPEAMSERTRELLEIYYRRENSGLRDLIGRDPFEIWGWK